MFSSLSRLSVLLVALVSLACEFVSSTSDDRPNIIFIFTDDWGFNDVSYHGGTALETDFIDTLAQDEGLILTQHYVLPTCTPSRAALLTGRYPSNLGMQHSTISPGDIFGVPLAERMISQELRDSGYSTHMIGKWHLGFCAWEYTPMYRGFDSFSGFLLGAESYSGHNRSVGDMNGFDLRRGNDIVEDADGVYSTYWHYSELSDLMVELQQKEEQDPFFIYLAWQNSHNPPEAPKSYLKKYKDIASGSRWFFMGQTAVLDDVMEDFIDELKSRGLWDNTLIVFSSDNGAQKDSGDNAPLRGAKSTLWEGAIRVPAFVTGGYLPEHMRGQTSNEMIHVTDWYSTFVSLAKPDTAAGDTETAATETDGFDVSAVILNGEATEREEFLINVDSVNCDASMCGALRYQNFKLIIGGSGVTSSQQDKSDCFWTRQYMSSELNEDGKLTIGQCGAVPADVSTEDCGCMTKACLFDLEADPCEYYDLSGDSAYEEVYGTLVAKLQAHYDGQVHPWKDIFATDYDNADPKLFGNFWSPWLTKEEAVKKQEAQFTVFQAKLNGLASGKEQSMKPIGGSFRLSSDMLSNSTVWVVLTFALVALMFTYVVYRAKRRYESTKGGEAVSSNVEQNPLLKERNSHVYNSVAAK